MRNLKIERLAKSLFDDLNLRLASSSNPTPVVVGYDASNDVYLTVTEKPGSTAIVKFETEATPKSGQYDSLGLAQTVYTPHITKLGLDNGAAGAKASGTATMLATLAAGDKLTVNGHDFVAENSGAAGDQFNLVGTYSTGTLTIGGGANTAFGAGKTITIGATTLTEGVDFAAGADAQASATAIQAAIAGNVTLATQVTAVANLGVNDSTVVVTSIAPGSAGNLATTTNDGTAAWGAATLTGGALDLTATAANLAAAISASATVGVTGVVTATSALAVVTITAVSAGLGGNSIPLTQTGGHITVSGATLSGGTNATAAGTSDNLKAILIAECAPTGTALLIYEKAGIAVADLTNAAYLVATVRNIPWGLLAQV